MVFYKAQVSNPEFWTFSQLFIARIMSFKTQVFNLQVLTQTEFETPKKSISNPKKAIFNRARANFWFTIFSAVASLETIFFFLWCKIYLNGQVEIISFSFLGTWE